MLRRSIFLNPKAAVKPLPSAAMAALFNLKVDLSAEIFGVTNQTAAETTPVPAAPHDRTTATTNTPKRKRPPLFIPSTSSSTKNDLPSPSPSSTDGVPLTDGDNGAEGEMGAAVRVKRVPPAATPALKFQPMVVRRAAVSGARRTSSSSPSRFVDLPKDLLSDLLLPTASTSSRKIGRSVSTVVLEPNTETVPSTPLRVARANSASTMRTTTTTGGGVAVRGSQPQQQEGQLQATPASLFQKPIPRGALMAPRSPDGWMRKAGADELRDVALRRGYQSNYWLSLNHIRKVGVELQPNAEGVLIRRDHPARDERLFNAEETTDPAAVYRYVDQRRTTVMRLLDAKARVQAEKEAAKTKMSKTKRSGGGATEDFTSTTTTPPTAADEADCGVLTPLTVHGWRHQPASAFVMKKLAKQRRFLSRYWVTQFQVDRLGLSILPAEIEKGVRVMLGSTVVSFYNAEQTSNPRYFTSANCKPVPPHQQIQLSAVVESADGLKPMKQISGRRSGDQSLLSPPSSTALVAAGSSAILKLDNSKAGMAAVDKTKVEEVINVLSKDSLFYKHEQRRMTERRAKNEKYLAKSKEFMTLSAKNLKAIRKDVAARLSRIEESFSPRPFVHIDMDMFFCAIEERNDPTLKYVPFAVGDTKMLATSNYIARKFGVRAAMPGFIAKKLCPHLVLVEGHMSQYREVSDQVKAIAARYDPNFSSLGLDEMTLDVSEYLKFNGGLSDGVTPSDVAARLRADIFDATGLTCSAGIACTPMMAKLVAGKNKPNGQFELDADTIPALRDYLAPLPVRKISGIGPATEELLQSLDIATVGRLYDDRERLAFVLCNQGRSKSYDFLLAATMGISTFSSSFGGGPSPLIDTATPKALSGAGGADTQRNSLALVPKQPAEVMLTRKSMSLSRTFRPLNSPGELEALVTRLTKELVAQLKGEGLAAGGVALQVKYRTFESASRNKKIHGGATDDGDVIESLVLMLLKRYLDAHNELRLVGVSLNNIEIKKSAEHREPASAKSPRKINHTKQKTAPKKKIHA